MEHRISGDSHGQNEVLVGLMEYGGTSAEEPNSYQIVIDFRENHSK